MDFGDRYKVLSTEKTRERKLDGMIGECFGWTGMSAELGLEVIGDPESKLAIKLYFKELGKEHLFAAEQLEFIDHGIAGTKMRIGRKTFVKTPQGEWEKEKTPPANKPWWRFWQRQDE